DQPPVQHHPSNAGTACSHSRRRTEIMSAVNQVRNYDVVVVGSGAGGLAAAVTAAHHGCRVAVVEKAPVLGGATSWSGGWAWTPGTSFAKKDGVIEEKDQFRTYLK